MNARPGRVAAFMLAVVAGWPVAAAAQTTLFDWALMAGKPGGNKSMSEFGMGIMPSDFENPGVIVGYRSATPVALRIWTMVSYNSYDGVCGKCQAVVYDGGWLNVAACDTEYSVHFDIDAGAPIGFGVLTVSPNWSAQVGYFPLTFVPPPRSTTGAGSEAFGSALANVGDLDGDGVDDLAVGAPALAALTPVGHVRVLSGATGAVLLQLAAPGVGDGFGSAIAPAADLDGDGVPEIAVGAPASAAGGPGSGLILIHSGVGGALLTALPGMEGEGFATSLDGGADADGDGIADLLVGAPRAQGAAGRVMLVSGATAAVVSTFEGAVPGGKFGTAVSFAGDLDGDGGSDLIVGSPDEDNGPAPGSGVARVLSSEGGTVLHTFTSGAGQHFGASVDGGKDIDADSAPDLVVGMSSPDSYGRVAIFSGATGSQLFELEGIGGYAAGFGQSVALSGDLDGDALPDIVVGEPELMSTWPHPEGRSYVFSGRDGKRLAAFGGDSDLDAMGLAVCDAGDADGDGVHELAFGAPGDDQAGVESGTVFVQGLFARWVNIGHALAGFAGDPWLSGHGLPAAGMPVGLHVRDAAPFAPVTLVLGAAEADLPFKGGVLVPAPQILISGIATNSAGNVDLSGHWPPGVPSALALYLQAWIVDPTAHVGLSASNGLRVVAM